jgi:hypothetical protein
MGDPTRRRALFWLYALILAGIVVLLYYLLR